MSTTFSNRTVRGDSLDERRLKTKTPRAYDRRALVALRADGLRCDLFVRSFNDSEHTVTYEVVAFNEGRAGIVCRIYGLDSTATTREFGMLTVPAASAGNSFFTVPLESGDRRRIFVEAIGRGVNVFAEAIQPSSLTKPNPWRYGPMAIPVAVILGCAYVFSRPSIEAFAAAPVATGNAVRAVYALGGIQEATYRATLSDGSIVAHGAIPNRSGVLTIPLPGEALGRQVRVVLDVRGPFGRDMRAATVDIQPDSMSSLATVVNRGSGLPAFTGGAANDFRVAGRAVAGRDFDVVFDRPQPDLRLTFRDDLQGVIEVRAVSRGAKRVTFSAPASPNTQSYSITRTFAGAGGGKGVAHSFHVYPQ